MRTPDELFSPDLPKPLTLTPALIRTLTHPTPASIMTLTPVSNDHTSADVV